MQPPAPPAAVPPPANFHCYGENSFTFLLFQALRENDRFRNLLLKNLMQFGTGNHFDVDGIAEKEEADIIWLFPSFGRGQGFGGTDALVLFGKYSFWFEVETAINLQSGLSAFRRSLLQMARFHFFYQALQGGAHTRMDVGVPHEVILGPTISNSGQPRFGILRLAGHPVLQRIRPRLATSTPHYVLLSEARSVGIPNTDFPVQLGLILNECSTNQNQVLQEWATEIGYETQLPATLTNEQCWYAYWQNHLSRAFPMDPITDGGYVRIASA